MERLRGDVERGRALRARSRQRDVHEPVLAVVRHVLIVDGQRVLGVQGVLPHGLRRVVDIHVQRRARVLQHGDHRGDRHDRDRRRRGRDTRVGPRHRGGDRRGHRHRFLGRLLRPPRERVHRKRRGRSPVADAKRADDDGNKRHRGGDHDDHRRGVPLDVHPALLREVFVPDLLDDLLVVRVGGRVLRGAVHDRGAEREFWGHLVGVRRVVL